jgi:hypothetical protein
VSVSVPACVQYCRGQPGATASVGEVAAKPGDEASATITFTDDRQLDLGLRKEDDQWCVSFMA